MDRTRVSGGRANADGSGFGNFFRYHGWLAPGVRLLRRLSFPAKSAWVAGAFLIPLFLMLFLMWSSFNQQIDVTMSERQGVAYVKQLLGLVQAAQARREAAANKSADLEAREEAVRVAFEKVKSKHAELGRTFGVDQQYGAFEKAHEGLLRKKTGSDADEIFEEHSRYIEAAMDLVREVADGSQLALDPGADTCHMVSLSILRGPLQYENTEKLSVMGTLILKSGDFNQRRRDWMKSWEAVQAFLDKDVENAYAEGIVKFPGMAKRFDMKGADDSTQAFQVLLKKQVLGDALSGDHGVFSRAGTESVEKQRLLMSQVLDTLDEKLSERIHELMLHGAIQLGVAGFFVSAAFYLMFSFYKVMLGGLREVSGHLKEITKGNLTTAPRPWGSDEAAHLMLDLRSMQVSLREMVMHVRQSSDGIVLSSTEIAGGSMDLSARTEQAAANLQESAASMEQMTATIRNTSEHTVEAADVAKQNAQMAADGSGAMKEVVATMERMRESSHRIGEIIGTIDGIAFQTNILALNAAVEAARAGEEGRGFAVVASEVRSLARRSAEAAKEIKGLISRSVDEVVDGTEKVRKAELAIAEIVNASTKVSTILGEISSGAKEQSVGIGQIGQSVQELDKMTQQNAALVEQTAAAATSMKEQALNLAEQVKRFQLPETA